MATILRYDLADGEVWLEPDDRAGLSEWVLPAYVPAPLKSVFDGKPAGNGSSAPPSTSGVSVDIFQTDEGDTTAPNFKYNFNDPHGPPCWLRLKTDGEWVFDDALYMLFTHLEETNWFKADPKIDLRMYPYVLPHLVGDQESAIEKVEAYNMLHENVFNWVLDRECSYLGFFIHARGNHFLWLLGDLNAELVSETGESLAPIYYYESIGEESYKASVGTQVGKKLLRDICLNMGKKTVEKTKVANVETIKVEGNCGLHVIHQIEKVIQALKNQVQKKEPEDISELRQVDGILDFNEYSLPVRLAMRYLLYAEEARRSRVGAFCEPESIPSVDPSLNDPRSGTKSHKTIWIPKAYDAPLNRPDPGPRASLHPFCWVRNASEFKIGDLSHPRVLERIRQYLDMEGTHGVLVKLDDALTRRPDETDTDTWEAYALSNIKPVKLGQKLVVICHEPTKKPSSEVKLQKQSLAFMVSPIMLPNRRIRTIAKIGIDSKKDNTRAFSILLNGATALEKCYQAFLPELAEFQVTVSEYSTDASKMLGKQVTFFYWFQKYEVAFPEGKEIKMDYEDMDRRTWWDVVDQNTDKRPYKAKIAFHLANPWEPDGGYDLKGAHIHHHHKPTEDNIHDFKYCLKSYIHDKESRFPWGPVKVEQRNVDTLIKRLKRLIAEEHQVQSGSGSSALTNGDRWQRLLDTIYLGLYQTYSWPQDDTRIWSQHSRVQCINPRCLEIPNALGVARANCLKDPLCKPRCFYRTHDCPADCKVIHPFPIVFEKALSPIGDDYSEKFSVSPRPPAWWSLSPLGYMIPGYKEGKLLEDQLTVQALDKILSFLELRTRQWKDLVSRNHHFYIYNYNDFYSKLEVRLANRVNRRLAGSDRRKNDDVDASATVAASASSATGLSLSDLSKQAVWVTDTTKPLDEMTAAYSAWLKTRIVESRREDRADGEAENEARRRRRRLFY